jgi:3-methyl-2-oxobutanoate hydroxymethyltransferase
VLVFHDVLGFQYTNHMPKFVRQYAHLAESATAALQQYCADVQAGTFPADSESYHMDKDALQALLATEQDKPATNE